MEKKIDRRVRKTKQQLQDGFIQLRKKKDLKDITVKELCELTDLNRGTFYLHYKDIYDLLEDVVSTESKKIIEEDGNSKTFYDECMRAFDVMMKYKNALLHIYNSRSRSVIEKYLMAVTPNFIRRFVTLNSENIEINEKNIIFICDFYKYAVTGCTIEWIRSGMPEEREEFVKKIADIFEATVSDAVKAFEIKKN